MSMKKVIPWHKLRNTEGRHHWRKASCTWTVIFKKMAGYRERKCPEDNCRYVIEAHEKAGPEKK